MNSYRCGVAGSFFLRSTGIVAVLLLGMILHPEAARAEVVSSPVGTGWRGPDCTVIKNESTQCPDIHDLYKYEIKPWYPQVEMMLPRPGPAPAVRSETTLTITEMPEIPQEPDREPEVSVSSVVNTDTKGGNLESDMVNALADFVADRAQAELVLWLVGNVLDDICKNDSIRTFFQNACDNNMVIKDSNYPSLSRFLDSFRRDMDILPAAMLCRYNEQDCRGYYLMNLLQGISAGIEPQYMIAGLAENDRLICGCTAEYEGGKPGKQCSLYLSGAIMQAYLDGYRKPGEKMAWEIYFGKLNEKLKIVKGPSYETFSPVIVRTAVENHYLLASIAKNIKKLREARTSRSGRIRDVMPYVTQLSRNLIALMEKSFAAIDKIAEANERERSADRERLETVINIIAAGVAGRYSDVMLDLQKMINAYATEKCETLFVKYKVVDKNCNTLNNFIDAVDAIKKNMKSQYCAPAFTAQFKDKEDAAREELAEFYRNLKACGDAYRDKRWAPANAKIERSFAEIHKYLRRIKGKAEDDLKGSGLDYCKEIARMSNVENELQKIRERLPKEGPSIWTGLPDCTMMIKDNNEFGARLAGWLEPVKKIMDMEADKKPAAAEGKKGAARDGEKSALTEKPEGVIKDIKYIYDKKKTFNEPKGIDILNKSVPIVTALATAQSKDEIKKVLEDTASPLGGWRIKQERNWTVSLTSLVGYQVAWEKTIHGGTDPVNSGGLTDRSDGVQKNSYGLSSGLLAPVGLDITWNCLFPRSFAPSSGVLLSVIDLGNLVNTRITGNDQLNTTDTSFRKVVSLGAYYHLSIPKTPAVWGVGYSYSPGLRSVEINGEERDRGTHRFMLFISLDVSLFYFR